MPLYDWIHSNLHDLNLDWIIKKIKNVETAEANSAASAADANAAKTAAAGSATAANNSKVAAAGSATAAAASAQTAQNLVNQLDTTIAADVEDWLDTHVTPTSPIVDDTLTIQGAAADAKKTGDEITDLKTEISDIFIVEDHESDNLLNPANVGTGYYWTNGHNESASYVNTGLIPIEQGRTYTMQNGVGDLAINRSLMSARFLVYYGSDGTTVISTASYVQSIQAPTDAAYCIASYNYSSIQNFIDTHPAFVEGTTLLDYEAYFAPYTTYQLKNASNSQQTIENTADIAALKASQRPVFTATADTLNANTNLICCAYSDNKKNEYIELTAKFNTFGNLNIEHGKSSFMGGYFVITPTELNIYGADGTLYQTYEHGLTITQFIDVIVYTKNDNSCRSNITIMSAGGEYTAENTRYYSSRAAVLCRADFQMTDVKLQYTVNDANEQVWCFGDSYISTGDPQRWANQLLSAGHKNLLLSGYGGGNSSTEIVPMRLLLAIAQPKYLVWTLGMNDSDSSDTVNANWKSAVDEIIATCAERNITPILATIPNTPTINNTLKNAYVRQSGCRYVDFAKAVNAESAGSTWYTGMLSSDNTHPTELGAKALMRRFLIDVPEVLAIEE